jgi:ABC-type Fe3+ transport system substrate-binding protein
MADIAMYGFEGSFTRIKEKGYAVPILAPSLFEKGGWRLEPTAVRPRDLDWLYLNMPLRPSLFINTKLVPPAEEPKGYQDLLQPKWKGKIVLQAPSIPGSTTGWFRATYRTLGLDTMRALAKQVALVSRTTEVPDGVARGVYAIGIAATTSRGLELISEGAPVKFVNPREGSHLSTQGIFLIANAPHINAAKLFLHWFYTKEGQIVYAANQRVISLRKDVPQNYLPPQMRYTEGEPFLTGDPEDLSAEKADQVAKLSIKIFEGK